MTGYRTYSAHLLDKSPRAVELNISTEYRTDELAQFNAMAIIVIKTGACWLQTYATAEQCRAIARAFLAAAADLDAMALEPAREAA